MSKKKINKNRNKNKTPKNTFKKNIDKMEDEIIEHQEIRAKYYIWSWLIFFFPVGIYKAIKYKAFKKKTIIIIITLITSLILLTLGSFIYSNQIFEKNVIKQMTKFEKSTNLGTYRFGERKGTLDGKYIIFYYVTNKGEYDVYMNNQYKISAIKQLNTDKNTDKRYEYISSDFDKKYKNIYSEIVRFYTDKKNVDKYGNIKSIKDSSFGKQTLETSKGTYIFEIKYDVVYRIYKKDKDKLTNVYTNSRPIVLPERVKKVLKERENCRGKVSGIISYELKNNSREYVVQTYLSKYYKIVLKDDDTVIIYNEDK